MPWSLEVGPDKHLYVTVHADPEAEVEDDEPGAADPAARPSDEQDDYTVPTLKPVHGAPPPPPPIAPHRSCDARTRGRAAQTRRTCRRGAASC